MIRPAKFTSAICSRFYQYIDNRTFIILKKNSNNKNNYDFITK